MLTPSDLHGIMAMIPCFTKADGNTLDARDTIDVENLTKAVDQILADDGADFIVTTGTFGEFHTLFPEEYETMVRATVEAVNGRVPVFAGCIDVNARAYPEKLKMIERVGANGALLGAPCYIPGTADNTVKFFGEIAEMFPKLNFMIYHNPEFHRVRLPVESFPEIVKNKNFIGMKDSHRTTAEFHELMNVLKDKVSVFPHERQAYPLSELGAAGFWSIDVWMGPEPLVALRDAIKSGDKELAMTIIDGIGEVLGPPVGGLPWRETGSKVGIKAAGYCDPGPLRSPFYDFPKAFWDRSEKRAKDWNAFRAKYSSQKAAAE